MITGAAHVQQGACGVSLWVPHSLEEDVVQSAQASRLRAAFGGSREPAPLGDLSHSDVVHVTSNDDPGVLLGIGNDSAELVSPGGRRQVGHRTKVSRLDAYPDVTQFNRGSCRGALRANEA